MSEIINFKIAKLLKEKNMTQKELAEFTNITESAISHYIKGDRIPRGVNLIKIAQALNVSAEYLLDQDSNENNNDFKLTKMLIARNAQNLTAEQKMEIVRLLTQPLEDN